MMVIENMELPLSNKPSWQENFLLALKALDDQQSHRVLSYILSRDQNQFYDLMNYVAENGGWSDDIPFIQRLIHDFVDFSWNYREKNDDIGTTWHRFEKWISRVSDSMSASILSNLLLSTAEDSHVDNHLRISCIEALQCFEKPAFYNGNSTILERLIKLAEDQTQQTDIRHSCIYVLEKLGNRVETNHVPDVMEHLLRLVEDEKQGLYLRRSCAHAIGYWKQNGHPYHPNYPNNATLKNLDDFTVTHLLDLAENENLDSVLRRECAEAVENIGNPIEKDKAINLLLRLVEDTNQNIYLRLSCVFSIGKTWKDGEFDKEHKVIHRLLSLVEDEKQDYDLRASCAYAVGKWGNLVESELQNKEIAHRLLHMATNENHDIYFRHCCVHALGDLGPVLSKLNNGFSKSMVENLFKLSEDNNQSMFIRLSSLKAVGNLIRHGYKDIENNLLERLQILAEDKKQDMDLRRERLNVLKKIHP